MLKRTVGALLAAASLWAQGTTSRAVGIVQDSSGAVVGGAAVTLTNEATGVAFAARTTGAGTYVFDSVQSGAYTLTVEAAGFKKFTAKANAVTIGQPTTINVTLQVGAVTEQVEVTDSSESVQTSTSGNLGNLFTERTIRDLPIVGTRGRNPVNLVFLQPGVVAGANTGGSSHAHGARDRAWNYTLDGIDVNETSSGGSETTPTKMNPDSLAEFRVITSNFTADSGRNSGAQVAMITRSGGNDLHGSLFEFYRTPRFNANEWQNNLDSLPKRQFVQHIYGGAVGGAIFRNKTFYFANVQLLRALETGVVTRTVYTSQARQGLLRYVRGGRNFPSGVSGASVDPGGNPRAGVSIGTYNVVSSDPQRLGLDKTTQALINEAPLPNRFDTGDGLNTAGYTFSAAQSERQHDITFKVDHILNQKNTLYARVYWGAQNTLCDRVNGGQPVFPGLPCPVNTYREPKNLAFNWRTNPTAGLTNELVVGLNEFRYNFDLPRNSFEKLSLAGPVDAFSDYSFGNIRALRTWQFVDNLSHNKGAHALKFGTNLRIQRHLDTRGSIAGLNAAAVANFSTGTNTVDPATFGLPADLNTAFDRPSFQSHINYLLGRVGSISRAYVANGDQFASALYNFSATYPEYDFYAQDSWKPRRNLTIDLGLRWESKLAPRNPGGRILHPDQLLTGGAAPTNAIRWVPGSLYKNDLNNLGPSIGFAWDPRGNGRMSVRGNYRIAYDRMNTFVLSSSVFQNLPGFTLGVVNTEYGQGGGRLAGVPRLAPPAVTPSTLSRPAAFSNNSITVVDPDLRTPATHQWSFNIQKEIARRTVLDVSYIGRRGYGLLGAYNANQADIFRNGFLQAFNTVKAGGESDLINRLTSADSRRGASESGSAMVRRLFQSTLDLNSVGALASSLGTRLQGTRSVTDLSGAGAFPLIAFPQFGGGAFVIDSNDFSTYHALEVQIERRLHNGFSFQLSYTLAKSLDTRSYDPAFSVAPSGAGQSASSTPFDINNRRLNYARSDFDRTHVVQSNWLYELPFGKGRGTLDRVIGGWELAGFQRTSTGRPFTVYSGSNTIGNAVQTPANCTGCARIDGQVFDDAASGFKFYFNDAERRKFSLPAPGQFGNTGRNAFTGPGLFNIDMALLKRVDLTERFKLELRADSTNLTNSPGFGFPTAVINSTTFGRIRGTLDTASRKIQLGAKINF